MPFTVWDQVRLWDAEAVRVDTLPFTSQTGNRANREHIHSKKKALLSRVTNNTALQDLKLYEAALERTPEDTLLIANYAQFLDGMGMTAESIVQAEKFRTLLPDAWTEYYMAALLAKAGRLKEAERCLEKAIKMNRDIPEVQRLLKQIQQTR